MYSKLCMCYHHDAWCKHPDIDGFITSQHDADNVCMRVSRYMTVAGVLPALQAVYGVTTLSLGGHKPGQMLYCLYEVRFSDMHAF